MLMPAAIATPLLGSASPWLAKLPLLVATFALHGITGRVRGLGIMRLADLRVAMPSAAVIACAASALAFAMLMARRRWWLASAGITAILDASLVLALIPPAPRVHPRVLEMTSIMSARATRFSSSRRRAALC
jgi:hypothetical protein